MLNGLHLYSAFLTSVPQSLTIFPNIHLFMQRFTHRRLCQPRKVTASSSGAFRVKRLAQGHLDTRIGEAGDRTVSLPVTSQPGLPPEPHAALG